MINKYQHLFRTRCHQAWTEKTVKQATKPTQAKILTSNKEKNMLFLVLMSNPGGN